MAAADNAPASDDQLTTLFAAMHNEGQPANGDQPSADGTESAGVVRAPRAGSAEKPPRDRVRTVARGVGQTLITAGLVVLLFVVYELYITDIFSAHDQQVATKQLDNTWQSGSAAAPTTGTDVVTVTDPNKEVVDPNSRKVSYQTFNGQAFAKIYIPTFGSDFVYSIIEGTDANDLNIGPGHYTGTQLPGQPGNFAVAGHRVSKGSPFNELGLMSSCDAIVIETKDTWFIYRVLPMSNEVTGWSAAQHGHCSGVAPLTGQYSGVEGREITTPSDYAQVLPVPHVDSTTVPANAQRLITLTTCHPQFSDKQRMIIHGVLVKTYSKATGFLPPELNEG